MSITSVGFGGMAGGRPAAVGAAAGGTSGATISTTSSPLELVKLEIFQPLLAMKPAMHSIMSSSLYWHLSMVTSIALWTRECLGLLLGELGVSGGKGEELLVAAAGDGVATAVVDL